MSINIYVIRHGQTIFNLFHRVQGICDIDLTEDGIEGAKSAGKELSQIKFTSIYSSDLKRAYDTANYIIDENKFNKLKIQQKKVFRELNFGYWEGLDSSQVWHETAMPYNAHSLDDLITKYGLKKATDIVAETDPFKKAEYFIDIRNRILKGLKLIWDDNKNENDCNVLLVTHGVYIMHLLNYLNAMLDIRVPDNCSITSLIMHDIENIEVKFINKKFLQNKKEN